MALQVTVEDMTTQVRRMTDQESSTVVTDAEIVVWINQGVRKFWSFVTKRNPDFFSVSTTITTTAGTLSYNIYTSVTDFALIRGLDLMDGTNRLTLEPFAFQERNRFLGASFSRSSLPRYRVVGNRIHGEAPQLIFDRDPGSNTYLMYYVPAPPLLVAGGANDFDGVLGFEDWLTNWAAYNVRMKVEETEAAVLHLQAIEQVKEDIASLVDERHRDGAPRIARTRRRHHEEFDEVW
jgi:hypothetical protein